jgi:hypothetical protein
MKWGAVLLLAALINLALPAVHHAQGRSHYYLKKDSVVFLSHLDARFFVDLISSGDDAGVLRIMGSLHKSGLMRITDRDEEIDIEEGDPAYPALVKVRLDGEQGSAWTVNWGNVHFPAENR